MKLLQPMILHMKLPVKPQMELPMTYGTATEVPPLLSKVIQDCPALQKLVAFNGGFEQLFSVVEKEGRGGEGRVG